MAEDASASRAPPDAKAAPHNANAAPAASAKAAKAAAAEGNPVFRMMGRSHTPALSLPHTSSLLLSVSLSRTHYASASKPSDWIYRSPTSPRQITVAKLVDLLWNYRIFCSSRHLRQTRDKTTSEEMVRSGLAHRRRAFGAQCTSTADKRLYRGTSG